MREGTAPCGVRYAVRTRQGAAAYTSLSIQAGTRNELGFHSGIAHFTEHTLFRGTARKSASVISSYLDRLGGELNAYTTKEEIVLHATVLREDILKAESLLVELAREATFPEREIATEKGVVIDEIIASKDSPVDDIYDRFESELFAGHPLGGLILGTRASVSKITPDELRRFVRERFTPSRMALTVVADLPEEKMEASLLRLLARTFGPGDAFTSDLASTADDAASASTAASSANDASSAITAASTADDAASHCQTRASGDVSREPVRPVLFDKVLEKHNHEVNAVIGGVAPSLYGGRERFATILLCNILGGPASNSLLGSFLRERNGWVYGIECSYTQYSDTGVTAITFGCDRPNLEKCLAAIDRILARIRTAPLTETRLKAAKKQLLCQAAISSESGEAACLSMGKSLLAYGRVITSDESRAAIMALTPDDILRAARAIFDPSRLSRLIYL